MLKFKSTEEIATKKGIIDQVIGQEQAVEVVKKAARQRRHILLIGEPGTGKSLLGVGLAQLLPKEKLVDIVSFSNPNDENQPLIRVLDAGAGRYVLEKSKSGFGGMFKQQNIIVMVLLVISLIAPWWAFNHYSKLGGPLLGGLMFFAFFVGGIIFLISFVLFMNLSRRGENKSQSPKVIVDNFRKKQAPFFDATGAHAGALLGDVLHDPFQTFKGDQTVTKIEEGRMSEAALEEETEKLFRQNKENILSKGNYKAVHLPKNSLFVYGEQNRKITPVEVLSTNKYFYEGKMIRISAGKQTLTVTPEHKIAVWKNGKTEYVEAKNLKEGDSITARSASIAEEHDLIKEFSASEEPAQIIQRLKSKRLLPLNPDNPNLPALSKIMGFAMSGIKKNALKISGPEKSVKEFGADMEKMFGAKNEETNPCIFKTSDKTAVKFLNYLKNLDPATPSWIKMRKDLERLFYGSLLSKNMSVKETAFSFATETTNQETLKELKEYLAERGITSKPAPDGLEIESKTENLMLLTEELKPAYGSSKFISEIQKTVLKEKGRYSALLEKGYGAEKAMTEINLTPKGLYLLLNNFSTEAEAAA